MVNQNSLRFVVLATLLSLITICGTVCSSEAKEGGVWATGPLVKREQRKTLVSTEYGEIAAVRITDKVNGTFLLHSFTLEPNALFLPVMLHADMVFYVHTGSGKLSWTEEDDLKSTNLVRGDVYRLQQGSVFFVQSNLETTETERQKLRIHAIFASSNFDLHEPSIGPYSSIRDMITGFDRKVLQAAFRVPAAVVDELLNATKQPAFIHGVTATKKKAWDMEAMFIRTILGSRTYNMFELNKKKKEDSADLFNIFKEDKDFENCNGWSTAVTRKRLSALRDTDIGVFMVNLTVGSMMGPHWNPMATEIALVLQGRGMVRIVCADVSNATSCRNMRFRVEEGDVFAVPRFHPMAQMAFNNETLVFMGFSTSTKNNHPQYLAGQASVLRTLDRDVLAMAFNVSNTTLDQFLAPQGDSVILACTSCAEEELRVMQEDMEREREETREKEKEAAKEREEEKRKEEEEARKEEEAAAKKQEEERKKREQEEEAAKQAAEAKRKQEEEAARQKEAEAKKKQEEEEAEAKRKQEEEAARHKEEAEAKRKQEEEERKRKEQEAQEAEAAAQRERERQEAEEQAARQQEKRWQQEQQEAERQRKEAEAQAQRERERQEAEEEAARQEEQRRQQEKQEAQRQREQAEEEAARRQEEEERQQRESAARQRREQERAARGRGGRQGEGRQGGGSEEEQAAEQQRRMEEDMRRQEEAARHAREQQEGGEGGYSWPPQNGLK